MSAAGELTGDLSWLREGLVHGAALSAFMGVLIVASLRHDPKIWAHSAPPAMRAQIGPIDAATRRRKRLWGVVMVAGLALVLGRLAARVAALHPGASSIPTAAAAYVCFQVFNLFDAVVIDLGLTVYQPRWAMIPGVDTSSLRDVRWHVKNYLIGLVAGVPFALVVAGLSALARAVTGP